jgi:hypothetical protein
MVMKRRKQKKREREGRGGERETVIHTGLCDKKDQQL